MSAITEDGPPTSDPSNAKRAHGKVRFVRETFQALDENGEVVTITRESRTRMSDGRVEKIEMRPLLSIPGLGEVLPIDDPVYQYKVLKTGMKLRRQT